VTVVASMLVSPLMGPILCVSYGFSVGRQDMVYLGFRNELWGMFLCLLVVGAGRVARGEIISGQLFIRANALSQLLQILAHTHPADDKSQLDNLDPFRRFEQVFPEIGAQINAALLQDPITGALSLLAIYEQTQSSQVAYRGEAVKTVRKFLEQVETC
ncbi:MAG: DUF389 domain-containing protein, partial [Chloroflexota bacterium]